MEIPLPGDAGRLPWQAIQPLKAMMTMAVPRALRIAFLALAVPFSQAATLINENFDSMTATGTTPPAGWTIGYLGAAGSVNRAALSPYAGNGLTITSLTLLVSDGSSIPSPDVGTAFNLGTAASPDRALGNYPRTSPSGDHIIQVAVVNNTGTPLSAVGLSYWGEQWRQAQGASSSGPEMLRVLVSTTSPTDGFTYLPDFDFTAPKQGAANVALDGNNPANRVFITNTITLPGSVPSGGTFYVRWHDWNDNGTTDHFLAIDDVRIVTDGSPAPPNNPPAAPTLVSPQQTAVGVSNAPALTVAVSDPDTNTLTVTFHGRVASTSSLPDFTFVALPDTQYYVSSKNGGLPDIFTNQTQWIVANRPNRNIAYVAQLGDCVETGDNAGNPVEWLHATNALYRLEDPVTTQHPPHGVPYGVAVGNHDQSPNDDANGTTTFYNQFFGEAHFLPRNYYGGHFGTNNDNHYDLFSASGMDFIVLYFEFDPTAAATNAPVYNWANNLLQTHAQRRAIVVSHWIVNLNGTFGDQGQAIYDALKGNTNLFLMLSGHVLGESRRSDTFHNNTVWSVLSDYQGRTAGGNGWLRLYEFSPTNNVIRVQTYSPWINQFENDADSQFDIPYSMVPTNPFVVIGTNTGVLSGANTGLTWFGLQTNTTYEWYATVNDGQATTTGPMWRFTTGTNVGLIHPTVAITNPTSGSVFSAPANITIAATAADFDGNVTNVAFYQGITKLADDPTVPYSHTWSGVAVGAYGLWSVATDNAGLSTTSTVVNITVNAPAMAPVINHVIHISVDGLRPDAITFLGAANLPNFYRLRTQGAFTDNARNDYDITVTLPNHTTQLTGRPVLGAAGHNWTSNSDPAPGQTLASNKGSYIAGVYDVAHDHGLRTGHYASKSKFSLFDTSWDASNGALDATGADHGRDKIDVYVNNPDTAALVNTLVAHMNAQPSHYVFLHLADPDTAGHASGWIVTAGSAYLNSIQAMDNRLGAIFSLVDTNLQLQGRTAIILTTDHGGLGTDHSNATLRENYTIPFYVWAPGVLAGADLYQLNPSARQDPVTSRPPYSNPVPPVRNGDSANLALHLLGLDPVPASTINPAQNLALTLTPPGNFQVFMVGTNLVASFSLVTNARHDLQTTTDLGAGLWTNVFTNLTGTGGSVTNISVGPATSSQGYYRLRLHF